MPPEADSAADSTAVEELRFLGDFVRRVEVATDDIAATAAAARWRARAADKVRTVPSTAYVAVPSEDSA